MNSRSQAKHCREPQQRSLVIAQRKGLDVHWAMMLKQYNNIHTLHNVPYLQTPHSTV
jgi:hypothetical protein